MLKSFLYLVLVLSFPMSTISNAVADQGMTSPVHKKNVGQIVWSKKVISFSSPDATSFQKMFVANDFIYGRIYQEKALNNYTVFNGDSKQQMRDGGYKILLYINGEPAKVEFGVFEDSNLTGKPANHWTTWQFSPRSSGPDTGEQSTVKRWVKAIRGLPAGNHEMRFELWPTLGQYSTNEPIAVGSFTLKLAAGDKVASNAKFPKDTYSGSDMSGLKRTMKKALVGPVAKKTEEIVQIAIRSDWQNGVYSKQVPRKEYRKITGVVLWQDTNNDNLCRYTSYNFIQDKTSSGWSSLRFHGFCNGCEEGEVECLN